MSVRHTKETAYGYLPTPDSSERGPAKVYDPQAKMPCEGTQRIMRKKWLDGELTLEEASAIAGRDVRKKQGKVDEMLPTPKNRDWKGKSQRGNYGNTTDCLPNAVSGQLNPDWVELLMGWPLGWSDITQPCNNPIPAWPADWEGDTPRVTTKTPHRVERLKAIGNGQVPAVAACAWIILTDRTYQPPAAVAR